MATLTTAQLRTLLNPPATPCASIYLPTHRGEPLRREDPIRYRNLVDRIEQAFGEKKSADSRAIVERLRALTEGANGFWRDTLDGAALFAAPGYFDSFKLPRAMPELAVVSDSFHVKPLLRFTQSADRFHVLGITRTEATLWEGNRYGLEVVPNALPTFTEAVGEELETLPGTQRSKIDRGGRGHGNAHYSGHGGRKDELDADQEKFLRAIDRAMLDRHSNPTGLPVVLVALTDNLGDFRKMTQNRFILDGAIPKDPGSFNTLDELRAEVWKVVEPYYLDRLAKMVDDYNTAFPRLRATGNVGDVARAAKDGRVGYLLVDADKHLPGRIDPESGDVQLANNGAADDVIDDIAELTLRTGGEVVVVPSERMPTESGLAAIFRF